MCTLIVAWQVFSDEPLLVAATRDELLDRPASPPRVLEEDPVIVAPRDEQAGGTWLGYNEHGVFVAITNRWTDVDLPGERSRGLLVMDALRDETAEAAARTVERSLDEHAYDAFNLFIGDVNAAILIEWDGHVRVRNFEPGVHVVTNVGTDDSFEIPARRSDAAIEQTERAARAKTELNPEPGESPSSWLERAESSLRDHEYGFCVHGPPEDVDVEYGTRSASLLRFGADGTVRSWYADGPPCEAPFEPVTVADEK